MKCGPGEGFEYFARSSPEASFIEVARSLKRSYPAHGCFQHRYRFDARAWKQTSPRRICKQELDHCGEEVFHAREEVFGNNLGCWKISSFLS